MYYTLSRIISLILGFILDQVFGDPQWFPHPVRFIGSLISFLEKKLNSGKNRFLKGGLCAVAVWSVTGIMVYIIRMLILGSIWLLENKLGIKLVEDVRWMVITAVDGILFYFAVAGKDLADEAKAVGEALQGTDDGPCPDDVRIKASDRKLEKARFLVSRIVGRDTACLDEEGIIKAAVETVAENASDGVIAPILAYGLFGPVGVWVFKANSTMDSMIGYRNERFGQFGTIAARVDDVMNWIPARVTAMLELMVGRWMPCVIKGKAIENADGEGNTEITTDSMAWANSEYENSRIFHRKKYGWLIYRRDCHNSESPNAGHPEAAMAAVLGIRLGGPATYQGVLHDKPYMGDPFNPIEISCIEAACRIMTVSAVICILMVAICLALVMILTIW